MLQLRPWTGSIQPHLSLCLSLSLSHKHSGGPSPLGPPPLGFVMAIGAGGGAGSRMVRRGSTLPIGGNPPRVVAMHAIPPLPVGPPFLFPFPPRGWKGTRKGGWKGEAFPFQPVSRSVRSVRMDGDGWRSGEREGDATKPGTMSRASSSAEVHNGSVGGSVAAGSATAVAGSSRVGASVGPEGRNRTEKEGRWTDRAKRHGSNGTMQIGC